MLNFGSARTGTLYPVVLAYQSFCAELINGRIADGRGCRLDPVCVEVVFGGPSSDRVCRGEGILTIQVVGDVSEEGGRHQSPGVCGYVSTASSPCHWDNSSQPTAQTHKHTLTWLCTSSDN